MRHIINHHEELVALLFARIMLIFDIPQLNFKTMRRSGEKNNKSYIAGYINLKTRTIVIDVYTPKTLKPKSLNSLIRTIAHEIAHIQKMPYRQRYKGKWIIRQHYPEFYEQVDKNIELIKLDPILGLHFKK